jgi:hypothetical protein
MRYCEEFQASLFVMFNVLGPDDLLHKRFRCTGTSERLPE